MKLLLLAAISSLLCFSLSTAQETNAWNAFGLARQSLGQETYGSALRHGLNGVDIVASTLRDKMVGFIPEPAGWACYSTNDYYSFTGENGDYSFSVQVEKTFSNQGGGSAYGSILRANLDNSLRSMERWDNLASAFSTLIDPGSYQLVSNRIRTNDFLSILDDNILFVPIRVAESNGSVVSGVLLTLEFQFKPSSGKAERLKNASAFLQDYLLKLPLKTLRWYLQ